MIMITMTDSGSLSLMEALRDSEIQKLGGSSCYHYNHHAYHCVNESNQLFFYLLLVISSMGNKEHDEWDRQ